eukprot:gene26388-32962_t
MRQQAAQKACLSPRVESLTSPRRDVEGLPPRANRRRSTTLTDEDLSAEMGRSTSISDLFDFNGSSSGSGSDRSSSPALERSLFEGFDWLDGDGDRKDDKSSERDALTMSAAKRTQQRLRGEDSPLSKTL